MAKGKSSKKILSAKKSLTKASSGTTGGFMSYFGSPSTTTLLRAPATFGATTTGGYFPKVSNVRDEHGCIGLRLQGILGGLSVISNSVAGGYAWRGLQTPSGTSVASLAIAPRQLTGAGTFVNMLSYVFDRFCFRALRFHYYPAVSSATDGAFVLTYRARYGPVVDTSTGEAADHGAAQTFTSHMTSSYWTPFIFDVRDLSTRENHFDTNDAIDPSSGEHYQGEVFVAHLSWPTTGNVIVRGRLEVEYILDFFDYSPNKSYSVGASTEMAKASADKARFVDSKALGPLTRFASVEPPPTWTTVDATDLRMGSPTGK